MRLSLKFYHKAQHLAASLREVLQAPQRQCWKTYWSTKLKIRTASKNLCSEYQILKKATRWHKIANRARTENNIACISRSTWSLHLTSHMLPNHSLASWHSSLCPQKEIEGNNIISMNYRHSRYISRNRTTHKSKFVKIASDRAICSNNTAKLRQRLTRILKLALGMNSLTDKLTKSFSIKWFNTSLSSQIITIGFRASGPQTRL